MIEYTTTQYIVDKKGRGHRKSSSLTVEVSLIPQRNSAIVRAINWHPLSVVNNA